jgi:Tol biopolymer transport system component/DNA-binding winged helix-turn-helix (wHTH) protein
MAGMIRFGVYELDRDAMELRKYGVLIRLQEQPFRVLAILAGRPGEIVTREELQEQIWGNTFVDFDQSLNKAINRVREALNDNASTPQYVETVPRRGYRFIAPVADIPQTPAAPGAPSAPVPVAERPQSRSPRSISRALIVAALATAVAAAIGVATVVWLRQSKKPTVQEPEVITYGGFRPVLSRDGKLLAYVSVIGTGPTRIWEQQTAGGEAIPLTSGTDPETSPDFSPDGTRIAFFSGKNGGGIYIAPTLPGEPRLIASIPELEDLRFSPSGDSILYLEEQKLFTVSVADGRTVSLPLNQDYRILGSPLWGPDGTEILFYGVRSGEQNEPAAWWIVPLAAGQPRPATLPDPNKTAYSPAVFAWVRTADSHEWIIYSTGIREKWKLWRAAVSPGGEIDQTPELLASGNGWLGGSSASADGKLAYNIWGTNASIYQMSTDGRGQKIGPTLQLPFPEGGSYYSPSVSRDGKWMAYNTSRPGGPNTMLLRDLSTGTDHVLDDKGRQWGQTAEASISPDGSRVIFERDCKEGTWPENPDIPLPCGFMVAAAGGAPEQVCERCTARGFSSDGLVVLLQKYDLTDVNKDRIVALDLRTRTERNFLSLADRPVFHPFFSWDDRWVVFKKMQPGDSPPSQIMIAPVRLGSAAPEAEWIAVTDGKHNDDKPQFSADGNTVYFTSTRDGSLCIWAQRLDPVTKHQLGPSFAYEHFHNAAGRASAEFVGNSDFSVARDKMLINLWQIHSDIWMTQMQ